VLERIVSGGQTGADRAALDAAIAVGMACGGWCPRGRRAEDGQIPSRYPLQETPGTGYPERTARNVRGSDATLVLTRGKPRGGTALTVGLARKAGKPVLVVDLGTGVPDAAEVRAWLEREGVRVLNVAGPRESEAPGIHAQATHFLRSILTSPPPNL
jgi:predicted Rossmann fold nucleotide-binding protein DprA/Smf involved in DNA uptake